MVLGENLGAAGRSSLQLTVDVHVGGDYRTEVDDFLETLIAWSVDLCGEGEFVRAKDEFFLSMGKVFHDDEHYHARMQYFIDVFLFERVPEQVKNGQEVPLAPFEWYLSLHPEALIGGFTHSLFRVIKLLPNGMLLEDILAEQKFRIHKQETELFDGMTKGDVFQGFVLHLRERSVLSRGLIFHPHQAKRILQKSVKQERKKAPWNPSVTLARLARQQLRHARLKHVDPRVVYAET